MCSIFYIFWKKKKIGVVLLCKDWGAERGLQGRGKGEPPQGEICQKAPALGKGFKRGKGDL